MLQAYMAGYRARHEYLGEDEVKKIKDQATTNMANGRQHIYFSGVINILPSFGGFGGRIDHPSTPEELKGVRVVLKVGDRIYQPKSQPGDLSSRPRIGENEHVDTETSTTFSPFGQFNSYYNVIRTQKYDYYQGVFQVAFDLFDSDGTPRVRPTDKRITAIVIYGPNERNADYDLSDILAARK